MANVGANIEGPPVFLNLEKKLTRNFLRTILTKKQEIGVDWSTTHFRETLSEAVKKETLIRDTMLEYEGETRKHNDRKQNTETRHQTKRSNDRKWEREYTTDGTPKWETSYMAPIKSEPTRPCAFCAGMHYHAECTKFKTYEERIECAKEKRLCFKCLRANHVAHNCTRPATCFKCKSLSQHPTALCKKLSKRNRSESSSDSSESDEAENNGSYHVKHSNRNEPKPKKSHKTLLMAIEATVFNPMRPNKSMTAVIFIDNGSQRSFISTSAVRQLDLPVIEKEDCLLTSFGNPEPKRYESELVKLGILGDAGDRILCNLNKLDFLVGKLPVIQLKKMEEAQLRSRKLDPILKDRKPDILLGMDMYYALEIRFLEKLPSGFVLCQSKLGKIISGQGRFKETQKSEAQITFVSNVLEHAKQFKEGKTKSESACPKKTFETKVCQKFNNREKQQTETRHKACPHAQEGKRQTTFKLDRTSTIPRTFTRIQPKHMWNDTQKRSPTRQHSNRHDELHREQSSSHRRERGTRHRYEGPWRGPSTWKLSADARRSSWPGSVRILL